MIASGLTAPSMREIGWASVTGLIDRAEGRGLVDRAAVPHDGRAIHVRLIAEGRRLTEQIAAQANETLSRLLDALPARDRARLSTLAGTVVRQYAASRAVELGTQRTRRS